MRTIKFKGKRADNGEWVYGYLCNGFGVDKPFVNDNEIRIYLAIQTNDGLYEVIPETVGQFTGLTDKNGKEIYEGDILKRGEGISFVVWGLDGWRYNSWMPESMDLYPSVDKTRGKDYGMAEVIGNIYDNPELLK